MFTIVVKRLAKRRKKLAEVALGAPDAQGLQIAPHCGEGPVIHPISYKLIMCLLNSIKRTDVLPNEGDIMAIGLVH